MSTALERVHAELERLERFAPVAYRIPGPWVGMDSPQELASAASFFKGLIETLLTQTPSTSVGRVYYNAMVRHLTSYDHGPQARRIGWRTTGTFLKMIAVLPYLRSLDVGTIVLLPINAIGRVGQKGSIGSPYSVRDPFSIEAGLSEPLLSIDPEQQARAFVDAAHLMGIRVITEVVLRTASLDSVFVGNHPEWFYWIHAESASSFSAPVFSAAQVEHITREVEGGSRENLQPPPAEYRRLFTQPPASVHLGPDRWDGTTADGEHVTIPGAFADWPVDDPQPAWSDVTYLRLHRHPDFNYMAYNTIRMFDARLEAHGMANDGAWNVISAMIPSQMRALGTDGAMIDMGHALPVELRRRVIEQARSQRPDAVMIEENFHLDAGSARDGFDIVTGYLPFDAHTIDGLRRFIERIAAGPVGVGYFGWVESHNTARLAERVHPNLVAPLWLFVGLVPGSRPCIVAGMELGETRPINTGMGFTPEQILQWPASELALFSDVPLPWDAGIDRLHELLKLLGMHSRIDVLKGLTDHDAITPLAGGCDHVVGFLRCVNGSRRGVAVVLNTGATSCVAEFGAKTLAAVSVDRRWSLDGSVLRCQLESHQILVIPTHLRV
jgi:starch synthase (maltosyl-transferring)